jgi:nitric oxide reductase NorQ protein
VDTATKLKPIFPTGVRSPRTRPDYDLVPDQIKELFTPADYALLTEYPDIDSEPAAKAATTEKPDSLDPIVRPNGELYLPRPVRAGVDTKLFDTALLRTAYENRIPVLLYGPPGTGKTALAEAALEGLITISGSGDTEVSDFVGSYVQNPDGTFTWVDGPLPRAMESGRPLLIDEVALIDTKVMAVVYSVMDGRSELHITANPARGTVHAADGFYVIGACNPDVPGAVMSEALVSRFLLQMEVLTDFNLAKKLGVPRAIIAVAKNLKRKADASELIRAPQMRELLAFKRISDILGQSAALANFVATAEASDRPTVIEALKSSYGVEVTALTVGSD